MICENIITTYIIIHSEILNNNSNNNLLYMIFSMGIELSSINCVPILILLV